MYDRKVLSIAIVAVLLCSCDSLTDRRMDQGVDGGNDLVSADTNQDLVSTDTNQDLVSADTNQDLVSNDTNQDLVSDTMPDVGADAGLDQGGDSLVDPNPGWVAVPIRKLEQVQAGHAGAEAFQQVQDIAYAPTNSDIVYMSVDTMWIMKSADGGQTWTPTVRSHPIYGATGLWVSSSNPDVVITLALTHNFYEAQSGFSNGYYRSTDGGDTWTHVFTSHTVVDKRAQSGNMFVELAGSLYGGHPEGLAVSSDSGAYWTPTSYSDGVRDVQVDPFNSNSLLIVDTNNKLIRYNISTQAETDITSSLPCGGSCTVNGTAVSTSPANTLYVACASGIYKSVNGTSYTPISPTGPTEYGEVHVSAVNSDVVYCMSAGGNADSYFFASDDGGSTWNPFGTPPSTSWGDDLLFYRSFRVAPHPTISNIAIAGINGKSGVMRTLDAGSTWLYSQDGYGGYDANTFEFQPGNRVIAAATDRGVMITDNGADWTWSRNGTALCISADGDNLLSAFGDWATQSPAKSTNGGNDWTSYPTQNRYIGWCQIHNSNPTNIFYMYDMLTMDGGSNWVPVPADHYMLATYPGDHDYVYAVQDMSGTHIRIRRSPDRGTNWTTVSPSIPLVYSGSKRQVQDMAIHPTNPDMVYIAAIDGVYITDISSNTVTKRDDSDGLALDGLGRCRSSTIEIHPTNPDIVWVGRQAPAAGPSNGVFISQDGGITWTQMDMTGLPHDGNYFDVKGLDFNPYRNELWLGSRYGVYRYSWQ